MIGHCAACIPCLGRNSLELRAVCLERTRVLGLSASQSARLRCISLDAAVRAQGAGGAVLGPLWTAARERRRWDWPVGAAGPPRNAKSTAGMHDLDQASPMEAAPNPLETTTRGPPGPHARPTPHRTPSCALNDPFECNGPARSALGCPQALPVARATSSKRCPRVEAGFDFSPSSGSDEGVAQAHFTQLAPISHPPISRGVPTSLVTPTRRPFAAAPSATGSQGPPALPGRSVKHSLHVARSGPSPAAPLWPTSCPLGGIQALFNERIRHWRCARGRLGRHGRAWGPFGPKGA